MVLAIYLLWTVVLPRTDEAVAFDDEVRAGDQIALTRSVVMTPAVGWDVLEGYRVSTDDSEQQDGPVALTSRGVLVVMLPGEFDGTPDELLDQVEKVTTLTSRGEGFHVADERVSLQTEASDPGVAEAFQSARAEGVIAAVVLDDGTGVEIQLVGPYDQIARVSDDVVEMVESIESTPTGASS